MQHAGLYIHIPFCVQKCLYCDFLSYSDRAGQISVYIEALCRELLLKSSNYAKLHFDTIFIGGGTPSCIPAEQIYKIIQCCREYYSIDPTVEISMEMNPGTAKPEWMEIYKQCGINRFSIGTQSSSNRLLKRIGRIHNAHDAMNTIQWLQQNHFTNYNLDFISAIPGISGDEPEQMNEILADIDFAVQSLATHISVYSMITEPDTPLYNLTIKGHVKPVDDAAEREMYHTIRNKLINAGFVHYEISNFARPGFQCKHNLKYWQGAPYLGVGLGSASYLPNGKNNNYIRHSNTRNFNDYLENPITVGESEAISLSERKKEYMMLGFRLINGPDPVLYQQLFQSNMLHDFSREIAFLQDRKLIHSDLSLTKYGLDFENEISREFI